MTTQMDNYNSTAVVYYYRTYDRVTCCYGPSSRLGYGRLRMCVTRAAGKQARAHGLSHHQLCVSMHTGWAKP
jgi:hypothetical protein